MTRTIDYGAVTHIAQAQTRPNIVIKTAPGGQDMNNVIDLSNARKLKHQYGVNVSGDITNVESPLTQHKLHIIGKATSVIRILLAICWAPIKWILSIDCFFQLMRMMYYWNDPSVHAGWTFMAHFSLFVGLMVFLTSQIQQTATKKSF